MNTPDSNPLFERIAEAAYRSLSLPAEVGMKRDYETTWAWTERMGRAQADQIAAAVLPIVAVEVRKAKAEAWDDGEASGLTEAAGGHGWPNPYRETEGSDEHR